MTKQDLIKLAEVAGHEQQVKEAGQWLRDWQPHIDIAQAFEVLEGFNGIWDISSAHAEYECELFPTNPIKTDKGNEFYSHISDSLPNAICQAVLKANKQER